MHTGLRRWTVLGLAAAVGLATATVSAGAAPQTRDVAAVCPPDQVPATGFSDIGENIHAATIGCVAWYALTSGATPDTYAPADVVTRGQVATFLARLLSQSGVDLPAGTANFSDVASSVHASAIRSLAALGVVRGYADGTYRPGELLHRDQMDAMLHRAYTVVTGTALPIGDDHFDDDAGNPFEDDINRLATAGIVTGTGDREFQPRAELRRDQFAAMVARMLSLLAERGAVIEGGADVLLDQAAVQAGSAAKGHVRTYRHVDALRVSGCGLTDQPVAVATDGTFAVTVPAGTAPGGCVLTFTVTTSASPQQTDTDTVTVDVVARPPSGPTNSAPTITTVADATIDEDTAMGPTGFTVGDAETPGTLTVAASSSDQALLPDANVVLADLGGGSWTVEATPAADRSGVATVTLTVSDAGGLSTSTSFDLTVTSVNDVPSFVAGADESVLEDASAQSVPGWATSISAGPAEESGQSVSFTVTNDNTGLFSAQPAVSSAGVLTYTPAADASGMATVSVQAVDDGGTANGGVDTSPVQTFTITVTSVNDAPSFVAGADESVLEDAGAQTVPGWATSISAGPADESGQSVSFTVTNDNTGLFSAQPAVSSAGVLTYTPAADASGTATVSVQAVDDGGTANGGVDTSPVQTFTITVTAVNDVPTGTADAFTTIGNTELATGGATASRQPAVTLATNVLTNDTDAESDPLTVAGLVGSADTTSPYTGTSAKNGTVTIASNGEMTYVPAAGETGPTDTFQYVLSDGTDTTNVTVTVTLDDMVWYVDNDAAAGGDGTSAAPFDALPASIGAPGDTVYVATGTGSTSGPIALKDDQELLGAGVALTAGSGPTTLAAAGTRPTIGGSSGAVVLASGNTVRGLDISTTGGTALRGASVGTATIGDIGSITSAGGPAVDLAGATSGSSIALGRITTTTSAVGAVRLRSSPGVTFSAASLDLTTQGGTALEVTDIATLSVSGTTNRVDSQAGRAIVISNAAAASGLTFSQVTATGSTASAVDLLSVTGPVALGRLDISNGATSQPGLVGRDVTRITTTSGTLSTGSATAVDVARSELSVSLTSLSSSGGTDPGVILVTTTGSFEVTGSGTAGSGGTISDKTGADGSTRGVGLLLVDATDVSLSWMRIRNLSNEGIRGTGVSGFSLVDTVIDGTNGTSPSEAAVSFTGLTGTAAITRGEITGASGDNVHVVNSSGTLDRLTLTGATIRDTGTSGNDGLLLEATGTAVANLTVTGGSTFAANRGDHVQVLLTDSARADVVIEDSTFSGGHSAALGQGLVLSGGGTSQLTYDISRNTITGAEGHALTVNLGTNTGASWSGTISSNTVGTSGVAGSGSAFTAINLVQTGPGTLTTAVTGNTLRRWNEYGIRARSQEGSGVLNLTVTGNTVEQPDAFALEALQVQSGAVAGDTSTVCAVLGGTGGLANTLSGATDGFRLRQRETTTFRLPDYTGGSNETAAVVAYVSGRNGGASGTATASAAGGGFVGVPPSACPAP